MFTTRGRHLPCVVVGIGCVLALGGVRPAALATGHALTAPRARGHAPSGVASSGPVVLRTVRVGLHPGAIAVDERTRRAFVVDEGRDAVNGHAGARGSVSVLDAATGAVLRTTAVGVGANAVAVDEQAGRVFVVNTSDGSVSVLDAATGAVLRTTTVGANGQAPIAVVADAWIGRVLVPTSDGMRGALVVLDSRTGAVMQTLEGYGPRIRVAVDARDGRAFIGDTVVRAGQGSSAQISIVDPLRGVTRRTITLPAASDAASVFPDTISSLAVDTRTGRLVVAHAAIGGRAEDVERGTPSAVNILDAATGAVRTTTTVSGLAGVLAIDQGAGRAVVVAPCATAAGAPACQAIVSVLDIGSGTVRGVTRLPVSPATTDGAYQSYPRAVVVSLAVDEQQGRAYVAFQNVALQKGDVAVGTGQVAVVDTGTGRQVRVIAVGTGEGGSAVALRERRVFVSNRDDGTVSVLDAKVAGVGRS